jgi:glycerol-3-phosphate dehydrogenase
VAQHLSDNYGDRAWTVCEYMEPTGERWPLYGKRLSPQYPCKPFQLHTLLSNVFPEIPQPLPLVLDAEVRYAVHNEYALTAVDFLARRSRLTFLNAQIALDVLPKVVEIMAQELRWSAKRRRQETLDTEGFMESMGVPLGSRPSQADQEIVNTKWAWNNWVGGWSSSDPFKTTARRVQLSRAQFEPGEVELLKAAWASNAGDERRIDRESARVVVLEKLDVPGLTGSEVDEVIVEVIKGREGVDQEEFLRVRPCIILSPCWADTN